MPRTRRRTSTNCDAIAFEHPETIVMRLLQDTLAATRRALNLAHPRCASSTLKVHKLDHSERLVAIMAAHFIEMDNLLDAYLNALRHQAVLRQLSQIDLPF